MLSLNVDFNTLHLLFTQVCNLPTNAFRVFLCFPISSSAERSEMAAGTYQKFPLFTPTTQTLSTQKDSWYLLHFGAPYAPCLILPQLTRCVRVWVWFHSWVRVPGSLLDHNPLISPPLSYSSGSSVVECRIAVSVRQHPIPRSPVRSRVAASLFAVPFWDPVPLDVVYEKHFRLLRALDAILFLKMTAMLSKCRVQERSLTCEEGECGLKGSVDTKEGTSSVPRPSHLEIM
ncbi:uncharacterized protein J3D65DRAFT_638793 [Phyllosticta citribraziliensis]|uniref:Uncharacterized protein n=1 Tax=Phyllosticta citribraziliensis TaxID=989973 RepID=A0ABR1L5Q7_9PEZI